MSEVRRITDRQVDLCEGVIWDAERQQIHYVDITGRMIYTCTTDGKLLHAKQTPDWVGCILLDTDGNLRYPMPNGLYRYDPDTGETQCLAVWTIPDALRFNDGKCAPDGAIFVGAMARNRESPNALHGGCLYRFTPETGLQIIKGGMTIPNGLAWRSDGRVMYHTDSQTRRVMAYEYDLSRAEIGQGSILAELRETDGVPDGMTIDAEDNLWVARWGGSAVTRYDGRTGAVLDEIRLPDKNVSCCCFGGQDMRTLLITTAKDEDGNGGYVYRTETKCGGTAAYRPQ